MSDGALVVDVERRDRYKRDPALYDPKIRRRIPLYIQRILATIDRGVMEDYHPDEVIYVVDKRQELHFVQVFRCAKKTGIVPEDTRTRVLRFWYDERQGRKAV